MFLRALEYYTGILILTTNRIRTFDEAVVNRMAMIAYYRALDKGQKTHIRQNCQENLEEGDRFKFKAEAIGEYEKIDSDEEHSWNGREIVSGTVRGTSLWP